MAAEELVERIMITFKIESFVVDHFEFDDPKKDSKGKYPALEFTTTPNINIQLESNTLTCRLDIAIKHVKSKKVLGHIRTTTAFWIKDIEQFFIKDEDEKIIGVNQTLSAQTLSIALSTTRGALAVKGEATACAENIYPVTDIQTFFQK